MKQMFLLGIALALFTACNEKQRYTQNSAEIETFKSVIKNYNDKDWQAMRSHYADTAKTFNNSIENPMSLDEVMAFHQQGAEDFSDRGFVDGEEEYEMVVTDKGETWVNFWGEWKGTMAANGKVLRIPIHLTSQFIDGKIVRAHGLWDNTPFVLALQENDAAKNSPEAEKKILASYRKFLDSWNQHDVELFKSIAVANYKRTGNGTIEANNRAENVALMEMYFTAFPDLHFSEGDYLLKDGTVHHQWIGTGTNLGEFAGNPPTGKKIKIYGYTATSYNKNGELLGNVTINDQLGMYAQLGYNAPELKK